MTRYRVDCNAVIQDHTSTTAAMKAMVATWLPPLEATIAKPAKKTTPVSRENAAQPRRPRSRSARQHEAGRSPGP